MNEIVVKTQAEYDALPAKFTQYTRVDISDTNGVYIQAPECRTGVDGWLDQQGLESKKTVILFKRVSKDFKTQEGTSNETRWLIGSTLVHPSWKPESGECGQGKFHACSRAYFCDEFRDIQGDRYVAIEVAKSDLHAREKPQYPHKIAVRKAKVLYECDRTGKQVSA